MISFPDTEVCTKNNKLYTKVYRKETDRQKLFYINSEHPMLLKNLSVKGACSTIENCKSF